MILSIAPGDLYSTPVNAAPTHPFDYAQNCVHCGLCLPKCPTYDELGDENDSPRGRIYLMQAVEDRRLRLSAKVRHHLDLCLDCRACETVCPSGVEYGRLIESFRANHVGEGQTNPGLLERLARWITFQVLPHPHRTKRLMWAARLAHACGFAEFMRASGLSGAQAANLEISATVLEEWTSPDDIPAYAEPTDRTPQGRAALFIGCVNESLLGETNRATWRVLLRNGSAVNCPPQQVCCGALHYHAGDRAGALQFAKRNVEVFERAGLSTDVIVSNVAGCGLMLKDYDRLLQDDPQYAEDARRFAGKVRDVHEHLLALGIDPPRSPLKLRVTYHEACHLCHGQGIRQQPRQLLRSIPGLELVEMKESDWCCGAAGSYSLTQPEMAARLALRKLRHVDETRSQVVAAGNAGCILHLRQYARQTRHHLTIVHPIELLDRAYAIERAEA